MHEIVITFSGSLISTHLVCLPGTISVARSPLPETLDTLATALFSQSAECTLLKDGKAQTLTAQSFFETVPKSWESSWSASTCLQDYLSETPQHVSSILKHHGLSQHKDTPIGMMSQEYRQTFALLAFIYTNKKLQSSSRLLIMKDPFKGLGAELREHLAISLLKMAEEHNHAILITYLSERAQSWIGNSKVHRLEINPDAEQTIGIDAAQLGHYIARSQATTVPLTPKGIFRHRAPVIFAVFLVGIFLVLVSILLQKEPIQLVQNETASSSVTPQAQAARGTIPSSRTAAVKAPPEAQKIKDFGIHEARLLSSFPEEIEESIKAAFAYRKNITTSEEQVVQEQEQKINQSFKNMLADLSESSNHEDPVTPHDQIIEPPPFPNFQESQPLGDADWEQRREEMRRKFLEAISQEGSE